MDARYLNLRQHAVFIYISLISFLFVLAPLGAYAQDDSASFLDLDIETLMDMEVSIASKKPQKISDIPAAVHVITQEDIRRSGVTSIPEALRMVPGIDVGRISSNTWAISSRGFNSMFANKLLVLIDGRSVYTPFFAGVYWDVQDTLLEDVDRIEVIRGPGASVWGANAVNGVINIITKNSQDTQGTLATAGMGTEERGFGGLRHGGKIGENSTYRIYAKYFSRDSSEEPSGEEAYDHWESARGGFKVDHSISEKKNLTVQGDYYSGKTATRIQTYPRTPPFLGTTQDNGDVSGGNILGRLEEELSKDSSYSVQAYYDRVNRDDVMADTEQDTLDFEFQHRFVPTERHELNWGLGYRWISDDGQGRNSISLDPDSWDYNLVTGFVQDEIELIENDLFFTVGTKLEHNDYTGIEVQPTARLLWVPKESHSIWTSFSRAVRTPSRIDDGITLDIQTIPNPDGSLSILRGFGNSDFKSEELLAYEAGYKYQTTNFRFDLNLFYNFYDSIRTTEQGMPYPDLNSLGVIIVPLNIDNTASAEVRGLELLNEWQPCDWLKLVGSYSYTHLDIHMNEGSRDIFTVEEEDQDPAHKFYLRSLVDLPYNFEFDAMLRYVGSVPAFDVRPYWELDLRLGYLVSKDLEIAVVGQNLLESDHYEYQAEFVEIVPTEIERGVYGKITWNF